MRRLASQRWNRNSGRAIGSGVLWPVVLREHATHDIFVDVDAEGMSDLLGDAYTAEPGVAALGYSGFKRWILGSVADKVLCGSDRPVLLVNANPAAHMG